MCHATPRSPPSPCYWKFYYVEQKNGVRGCNSAGTCWHTVFLHSTVHGSANLSVIGCMNPASGLSLAADMADTIFTQPRLSYSSLALSLSPPLSLSCRLISVYLHLPPPHNPTRRSAASPVIEFEFFNSGGEMQEDAPPIPKGAYA